MLIDLVEIAKRIFRSDSWEYVFGGKGQDKDGDYFSETDCSWLVYTVIKQAYNIDYLTTKLLNDFNEKREKR